MIRYIHIGSQIEDDADAFALFDTIPSRFIEIGEQQTFADRADLEAAMDAEGTAPELRERILGLVPYV